jgi:hypothetical protein
MIDVFTVDVGTAAISGRDDEILSTPSTARTI